MNWFYRMLLRWILRRTLRTADHLALKDVFRVVFGVLKELYYPEFNEKVIQGYVKLAWKTMDSCYF